MANQRLLILTDAHRQQIEKHLRQLAQLRREIAGLMESGVLDCKDYSELCDFVEKSLQKKLAYFWPRGKLHAAKKGGEE